MTLTPYGYKRQSYEEYVVTLQQEARDLFGNDINLNDDSTIGQFIKLLAFKDSKIDERIESVYLSDSIDNATGISLDYAVKKLGLSRRAAQPSTGTLTIYGDDGTVIPVGYIVSTSDGLIQFVTTDQAIITGTSTTVGISCTSTGIAGNVPANTVTTIRTAISGVSSVTNSSPTVGGLNKETDSQLRARYFDSLSAGGGSSTDSLRAAIFELPGVIDVTVDENTENVEVNGIPPHSIAPFVYGGNIPDIAAIILKYKAAGIKSFGTINTTLYDSQGKPKIIGITRPIIMTVDVKVTVTHDATYPADGDAQIKERIVKYIGGFYVDTDYPGLGLGEDIIEFKIISVIADIPGITGVSVQFSTDNGATWFNGVVNVDSNRVAKTNDNDVVVIS